MENNCCCSKNATKEKRYTYTAHSHFQIELHRVPGSLEALAHLLTHTCEANPPSSTISLVTLVSFQHPPHDTKAYAERCALCRTLGGEGRCMGRKRKQKIGVAEFWVVVVALGVFTAGGVVYFSTSFQAPSKQTPITPTPSPSPSPTTYGRDLPLLFVFGEPKCGSSSFVNYLWRHPSLREATCRTEQCWDRKEMGVSLRRTPGETLEVRRKAWLQAEGEAIWGGESVGDGGGYGVDGTLFWSQPDEIIGRALATQRGRSRFLGITCDRESQAYSLWRFTGRAEAAFPVNAGDPPAAMRRASLVECIREEWNTAWTDDGACVDLLEAMKRRVEKRSRGLRDGGAGLEKLVRMMDEGDGLLLAFYKCSRFLQFQSRSPAMPLQYEQKSQHGWFGSKAPCSPYIFSALRGPTLVALEAVGRLNDSFFADRAAAFEEADSVDFFNSVTSFLHIQPFPIPPDTKSRFNSIEDHGRFYPYFFDMMMETPTLETALASDLDLYHKVQHIWSIDQALFCSLAIQSDPHGHHFLPECTTKN